MELYHIHLLGNHDKMYKPNSEIIINKDLFNNRLYDKAMNYDLSVMSKNYPATSNALSLIYYIGEKMPASEVISFLNSYDIPEERIKLFKELKDILFLAQIAKRELSIEQYRKENAPDKPSRMHSLFACFEEGVESWKRMISEGDSDIYRIDVIDEPFITNEQLLPPETSSYIDSYNGSMRYFNPRNKDLNKMNDEILVQGKVKILEKVDEVRRNN